MKIVNGIIVVTTALYIASLAVVVWRVSGVDKPQIRCDAAGVILQQEVASTAPNGRCIMIGSDGIEYVLVVKE